MQAKTVEELAMIEHMEPGRYRTRNGKIAIVAQHRPSWVLPWHGAIEGCADCWGSNGEYIPGRGPHCKDLMARLADDPDDRIERALQVLRNAQTWELRSGHRSGPVMNAVPQGGDWAEAETLDEVRKILEGQKQ